jgi:hypothetical protein
LWEAKPPPTSACQRDEQVVDEKPIVYRAYMLRIWLMDNDDCPQWCLSLEDTHEEFTVHFKSLADFLIYLLSTMDDTNHKDNL